MWFKDLKPDEICKCFREIDFEALAQRGLVNYIFDVDNTIALRKSMVIDPEILEKIQLERKRGNIRNLSLVSNIVADGGGRETRVAKLAEDFYLDDQLGSAWYVCACWPNVKPKKTPFVRAMSMMRALVDTVVVVGDQLFTDIQGGNRLGLYTIWVPPMGDDHIMTCWKRWLELFVARRWENSAR